MSRLALLWAALLGVGALTVTHPSDARSAEAVPLIEYRWSVGALGSTLRGSVVVAVLEDGSWRASVGPSGTPGSVLVTEQGEGWTIIGLGPSEVWLAEWRGPARSLDPDTSQLLHRLVAGLGDETDLETWSHVLRHPVDLDADLTMAPENPGLSERLARRADGRGGPGETWWFRPSRNDEGLGADLTSRRRPGALTLRPQGVRIISVDPFEFLVPAWSIDELDESKYSVR